MLATAPVIGESMMPCQPDPPAAYLHDIGYAEPLVDTGFHPLDGAVYLRGLGCTSWRAWSSRTTTARTSRPTTATWQTSSPSSGDPPARSPTLSPTATGRS